MAHSQLLPLDRNSLVKYPEQQLKQIQQKIHSLTHQLVSKGIQLISSQKQKITKFSSSIQQILQTIQQSSQSCHRTMSQLQKQISSLKLNITLYQQQFIKTNRQKQYKLQIQQLQKLYLKQWQKRIELAQKINLQKFKKILIENRKSKANQVFKWIIVTIYQQSQAKYYWPNFQKEVFQKQQGKDFKERLGKVNASNAKQQAKIKTNYFIQNYSQIITEPELINVKDQVQKIYNVAQIFLKCYQISRKVKQLQLEIVKSKQKFQQKDQQSMRWKARVQALQDRIKTNKQYLNVLKSVQAKLNGKVQSYQQKEKLSKLVIETLQKQGNINELIVNIQDDKKDLCDCVVY